MLPPIGGVRGHSSLPYIQYNAWKDIDIHNATFNEIMQYSQNLFFIIPRMSAIGACGCHLGLPLCFAVWWARLNTRTVSVNCFHHLCLFLMFYEYVEHFAGAAFPRALSLITYSQHFEFVPCRMCWALILIMYKTHLQGRNSASVMLIKRDALLGQGWEAGNRTEWDAGSSGHS